MIEPIDASGCPAPVDRGESDGIPEDHGYVPDFAEALGDFSKYPWREWERMEREPARPRFF